MMVGMLVAGFGFVLASLLAIYYGIQIKEFSFGNTLILTGVIGICTGAMMLALWVAVRELKSIARRLGSGISAEPWGEAAAQPVAAAGAPRTPAPGDGGFLFSRDQPPAAEQAGRAQPAAPPSSPPPWHEEAASRDRPRSEVPTEAAPAVKSKRNLLFSSSSRKERERAQTRTSEPLPPEILPPELRPNPPAAPPPPEEASPASFEDAWPKSERPRPGEGPPQRRSPRDPSTPPSTFSENSGTGRNEDQPQVTILKSGVVDGMAYSLYSDGSIEAQMPEGMMRFASIDELRSHLDRRP